METINYKDLSEVVAEFLSTKNTGSFCDCGYRQAHKLIWCARCGGKFANGYTPKTTGGTISWLIDKRNRDMHNPPKYYAAIKWRSFKKYTNNSKLTIDEITKEIEKQLSLCNTQ